jgi:hypothetical protein
MAQEGLLPCTPHRTQDVVPDGSPQNPNLAASPGSAAERVRWVAAMTDSTDPTMIDRDTALVGLTAIGVDLYDDGPDPEPGSILGAKRAVFAHHFDPIWHILTNDDRRWLREKLDREDGAFDRMVADYELRSTTTEGGA